MANIFDYMQWRDIEIEKVEFNEIDALILSRLSYFPFDNLMEEDEEITVKQSYKRYKQKGKKGNILQKEDLELFEVLAKSKRFGNVKVTQYINKIDFEEEKQFSAITILLPDKTIFVSYRGTDNTLVAWKEDFNMSFTESVPAQKDAIIYLENIAKKYKEKLRVGGHSKGGHLAMYASSFCDSKIKKRIIQIYNNDGPGLYEKAIESKEYQEIVEKIHTYMPQTSIFGRMLNHKEKITIIKSTQTGVMQHDLYSWQVLGDKFIESEITVYSEFVDKTLTNWVKEVSPEKRRKMYRYNI